MIWYDLTQGGLGEWIFWLSAVVFCVWAICGLIVLFSEVPWWKPFAMIGLVAALAFYVHQCAGGRGVRYSGGPVLDQSGHVVGVVVSRLDVPRRAGTRLAAGEGQN